MHSLQTASSPQVTHKLAGVLAKPALQVVQVAYAAGHTLHPASKELHSSHLKLVVCKIYVEVHVNVGLVL